MLAAVQRPQPFGKYVLLERISVGGMAEVFKAKSFGQLGFTRFVAIKRILPHLAEDQRFVDMFITEAKMAVQLTHTSIAQIIELGREGDDHYIAMEYIGGRDLLSLHHHFRKTRRQMPVELVAYIGARVAEGLSYAHRKRDPDGEPLGIVHRDVSPQNVLVSWGGEVKLIDFGIAKARVRSYQATQAGVLKGKFGYMSPEQIGGKELDHRSDIFALGTVLHELLTRKRLFHGENDFLTLELVRAAEVPLPSERNPEVPPELDAILMRALTKEPDDRYSDASELAEALARFLHAKGVPMSSKPLARWMRTEFASDIAAEAQREANYAKVVLTSDGRVLEADTEDDEEPTALWDPVFDDSMPGVDDGVTGPLDQLPDDWSAQATPTPAPKPEPAVTPRPNPFAAAPTGQAPAPPSRRRREIIVGAVVLPLAVVGGVVAHRLTRARAGGAGLVLRVDPPEGARAYLDDKPVSGTNPFVLRDVAPGAYEVRVERPGYTPWLRTVVLDDGQMRELDVQLARPPAVPARLRLVTVPADAKVSIGGRAVSPGDRANHLDVPAGRPLAITAVRDGYLEATRTVTLSAGQSVTETIELVPTPGSLFIDARPPGDVFLDDRKVGRTPYKDTTLDVGKPWRVKVTRRGYRPYEELVRFGERRTVQIEAKLVRR